MVYVSAIALEQDRDSDRSDTIIEDGHISFVLVGFPFGLKLPSEKGKQILFNDTLPSHFIIRDRAKSTLLPTRMTAFSFVHDSRQRYLRTSSANWKLPRSVIE